MLGLPSGVCLPLGPEFPEIVHRGPSLGGGGGGGGAYSIREVLMSFVLRHFVFRCVCVCVCVHAYVHMCVHVCVNINKLHLSEKL